jgi:hypothetical protein
MQEGSPIPLLIKPSADVRKHGLAALSCPLPPASSSINKEWKNTKYKNFAVDKFYI